MASEKNLASCVFGVLAAAMLAVLVAVSPAYAVTISDDDATYAGGMYVSFGDSITVGYSPDHTDVVGYQIVKGSYPNRLAGALALEEKPCSLIAARSDEILRSLGGEANDDYYYKLKKGTIWKDLEVPDSDTINGYVQDAQLITLEVGGADLFSAPLQIAAHNTLTDEEYMQYSAQIEAIAAKGNFSEELVAMLQLMQKLGYYTKFVEEMAEQMTLGAISYNINLNEILSILSSENEGGNIVVVGLYNPYRYATFSADDVAIKIGLAANIAVASANACMKTAAEEYGCTFVDVTEAESYASKYSLEVSAEFSKVYAQDHHPTATGNEYIAQQIADALPACTDNAVGDFARRLYTEVLGRTPDASGLVVQAGALRQGAAPAEIVLNFFNSVEYQAKGEDAEQTIQRVYRVMFGRAADAEGLAYWKQYFECGMTMRAVVAGFSQSDEYKAYFASMGVSNETISVAEPRDVNVGVTGFVYRLYTLVLGREAEAEGLNVQCSALLGGTSCSQLAWNFFTSAEFKAQGYSNAEKVKICYRALLGRECESQASLNYWSSRLSNEGMQAIVFGFCESEEFAEICAKYGMVP